MNEGDANPRIWKYVLAIALGATAGCLAALIATRAIPRDDAY